MEEHKLHSRRGAKADSLRADEDEMLSDLCNQDGKTEKMKCIGVKSKPYVFVSHVLKASMTSKFKICFYTWFFRTLTIKSSQRNALSKLLVRLMFREQ